MSLSTRSETALLAGGCFWGMQALFRDLAGVVDTRVGYSGGEIPNPTYRNHGAHAESIQIEFDPDRVSYRQILEFFFALHDPTTKDRQGNDVGSSYRSAIFYLDATQQQTAEATVQAIDASGIWPGPVVTQIRRAGHFWQAEPEHQDYLDRYPNGYTCHFIRPEWKLPGGASP
jgi:peptide-methionine (S)-S-oxide reductase